MKVLLLIWVFNFRATHIETVWFETVQECKIVQQSLSKIKQYRDIESQCIKVKE